MSRAPVVSSVEQQAKDNAYPIAGLALALLLLQLVWVVHGAPPCVDGLVHFHHLCVELHVLRLLFAHLQADRLLHP